MVFWGSEQVDQLPHLRLERGLQIVSSSGTPSLAHLEEELDNVDVIGFFPEVRLEQLVNSRLEHESVVDGNVAHSGLSQGDQYVTFTPFFTPTHRFVPARLATSGDAGVHHVVRDEEVRLELHKGD